MYTASCISYISICFVLKVRIHPSITNTNPLQVLDVDRVALQYDLSSGWDIVTSYSTQRERERERESNVELLINRAINTLKMHTHTQILGTVKVLYNKPL